VLIHTVKDWEPYRLLAALNAHLPPDARILAVQPAPEAFFPRHHALAKRYIYSIQEGPAEDPFTRGRRWHVHGAEPLDRTAMAEAAPCLIGEHNFSSFRHQECAAKTPVRTIHAIRLDSRGPALDLVFEGNRFLMHQVRIMAGTLVDIGKGRIPAGAMADILASRNRQRAGLTAPPHGLYLDEVWYQAVWGIGAPSPWGEEAIPSNT
jgi:tRNA pseudouridine38-40 synthase